MTIAELIEVLKQYPRDQQAFVYDVEDGYFPVAGVVIRDNDPNYPVSDFNPAGQIVLLTGSVLHDDTRAHDEKK